MLGRITERDRKLFQFLFENKVATQQQLKQKIFPEITKQTAFRRMKQLARSGWLNRLSFAGSDRALLVYGLTARSYNQYVKVEGVNDQIIQFVSDKLLHDLTLVDLRLRLESRPKIKRVYPENVLQTGQEYALRKEFKNSVSLNSDAVIELKMDEQTRIFIPFEFEGSQKSAERWQKKMHDYYLHHNSAVVLWVCKDESIINKMSEIDQEVCAGCTPKMYFASLEKVLNEKNGMTFTNSKKDKKVSI